MMMKLILSKECAKRWRHFLDPDLDHSRWEPEDDARLWTAVLKYGSNWRKIVEEVFPERSPNNVKNRYTVIQNLRRRGKEIGATSEAEPSDSLFVNNVSDGISNFDPLTTDLNTPPELENTIYPGDVLDDDFGLFLNDSLTSKALSSSQTTTTSLAGAVVSNSSSVGVPELGGTILSPASVEGTQPCDTTSGPSAETLILKDGSCGIEASMAFGTHFGSEAPVEVLWEPHNSGSVDESGCSATHKFNNIEKSAQTRSIAKLSQDSVAETRKVSLVLEDMHPETANRVTSMLLNSNVDVKMKMTVR
ncbi:MAG: hypothetical protein Q9191_007658 [Dirinaria sp. TL-2023a]